MHRYNYIQWIWLNIFQGFFPIVYHFICYSFGICNPEKNQLISSIICFNSVKSFTDLSLNQICGNNLFIKLKSVTHVMSINVHVVRINYGVIRSLHFSLTGHPPLLPQNIYFLTSCCLIKNNNKKLFLGGFCWSKDKRQKWLK